MPQSESAVRPASGARGRSRSAALLVTGVLLCGLCCSLPLLVGIGVGGAALTTLGGYAEKVGIALVVIGLLGLALRAFRRLGAGSR